MVRLTSQTWLIAAGCAGWAIAFLTEAPGLVQIVVPAGFMAALLLAERHPVAGAALVGVTQGVGLLLGAPQDNASGLGAGLTSLFLLGRRATVARGAPAYAVCAAVILATDAPTLRLAWGVLLFAAVWLAGAAVRHRADAAQAAAVRAAALTSVDPRDRIATVTAAERERLGDEAVAVIRACLVRVGEVANAARDAPSREAMVEIRRTGTGAVDRLRSLLVLLRRCDAAPPPEPAPRGRADLEIVGAVAVLGGIDLVTASDRTVVGVAVLVMAVVALLLRHTSPVLACVVLTVPLLVAVVIDEPIVPGMAELATYGLLAWSVVGIGNVAAWGALALLVASALLADRGLPPSHVGVVAAAFAAGGVAAAAWHPLARRQHEADLTSEAYEEQVRAAVAREIAAERRRMARDLHDLVSESVAVAMVHANAADALAASDPAGARGAVDQIIKAIDQAQRQLDPLQGAIEGMPVVPTDAASVGTALEHLAAEAAALGLTMELDIGERVDDATLAPVIVRVAREAVANAAKYAPGSAVAVSVEGDGPRIRLEIVDDGPSGEQEPIEVGTGNGLRGLAERVDAVGGSMVAGPRGDGFAVQAWLPRADG